MSYLAGLATPWLPATLRTNWPGSAIALVIALAASFVSTSYGGPRLLYALFFGIAFHFLSEEPTCRPGIEFCSRTLLRVGVGLLGARITLGQITSLGIAPIAIVLAAVLLTMLFGCALARVLKRPPAEGVLSGGAVAICGASAALAISAVLPPTRETERFTLLTVVGVTTLSTLSMVLYPLVVRMLGLDAAAAGVFIGGTIHDVAQVVGAGHLVSSHATDVAIFVKLTRVACLVPVVLVITLMFKSAPARAGARPPLLPFFLIGFLALMCANSIGLLPAPLVDGMSAAAQGCLLTAIAALGIKTSFKSLAQLGWQPVLMLVADTVWIAAFVLIALIAIS